MQSQFEINTILFHIHIFSPTIDLAIPPDKNRRMYNHIINIAKEIKKYTL